MSVSRGMARALLAAALAASCNDGTAPPWAPAVAVVSPDRGPLAGGTSVTITGTNFSNITGVTFDGVELINMVVISSTTITGTTPPGTRSGSPEIVVTSARRGSGRCRDCFRFTQFPGPLLLRLSTALGNSSQALGAVLIRVEGGAVSAIASSGPAVSWSSPATTRAHVIVSGDLTPGMVLATVAVADTQEAVRQRYSVLVQQATGRRSAGYPQLDPARFIAGLTTINSEVAPDPRPLASAGSRP